MFVAVRQLMEAGAKGFEIVVSGKLSSERAKFEKLTFGKLYKIGYDAKNKVRRAVVPVLLKPGIYGIEVQRPHVY
jgi:small subunit ribosomal protein S3